MAFSFHLRLGLVLSSPVFGTNVADRWMSDRDRGVDCTAVNLAVVSGEFGFAVWHLYSVPLLVNCRMVLSSFCYMYGFSVCVLVFLYISA